MLSIMAEFGAVVGDMVPGKVDEAVVWYRDGYAPGWFRVAGRTTRSAGGQEQTWGLIGRERSDHVQVMSVSMRRMLTGRLMMKQS